MGKLYKEIQIYNMHDASELLHVYTKLIISTFKST